MPLVPLPAHVVPTAPYVAPLLHSFPTRAGVHGSVRKTRPSSSSAAAAAQVKLEIAAPSAEALGSSGFAVLADRSRWPTPQTAVAEMLGVPAVTASVKAVTDVASGKGDVMRKHMTRVYDELLATYPNMVYIGRLHVGRDARFP